MPFAPPEPTQAPRTLPPTVSARDKRPAGSGFSSMVDEKAPAKAEARPQAAPAQRSSEAQDPPAIREANATTSNDAAKAADVTAPRPMVISADAQPDQLGNDTPKASEKAAKSETSVKDAQVAADPATLPADPAAGVPVPNIIPDQPVASSAPAPAGTPVPVAIAMSAPQTVSVPTPAQTSPAPLAIAAAGLAAAKAAVTKTSDKTTASIPSDTTSTDANAESQPTIDGTATKAAIAAAPKIEIKLPVGFAKTDATSDAVAAPEAPSTPAQTPTAGAPKAEIKPETVAADGKPLAVAAADASTPGAAPAKPADIRDAAPVRTGDFTGLSPAMAGPAPAHHAASTTVPSPTAQLTASVATAQPVPLNGLAVELAARATSGATRFEIRLDPAELGRIDVRIDIDKHGQVTSHLTVEKPETLAMLRQDSPQLQRALNDAGFKTTDSGMQFSLGDQSQSQAQQQRQDNDGGQRHAHRLFIQDDEAAAPLRPIRDYGRLAAARSGVDISV